MRVCSLCGLKYSEAEAKRPCRGCPLDSRCHLLCCPNCGYQTPTEPRWLIALQDWWQNRKNLPPTVVLTREQATTRALTLLEPGQIAEVVELCPPDDTTLRKLVALGLLPGVRLTLLRRFPCYLLQLGHAQLAMDQQLASTILVRLDG